MSGAAVTSLENKELKWEKNANLNIGIEAKLFDRVSATIEWYQRKTTDMLMSFPMATSLGFDGYNKNVGSMRNTGIDLTLGVDIFKDTPFTWNLTLLGSTIKNKVLQLADKPDSIQQLPLALTPQLENNCIGHGIPMKTELRAKSI